MLSLDLHCKPLVRCENKANPHSDPKHCWHRLLSEGTSDNCYRAVSHYTNSQETGRICYGQCQDQSYLLPRALNMSEGCHALRAASGTAETSERQNKKQNVTRPIKIWFSSLHFIISAAVWSIGGNDACSYFTMKNRKVYFLFPTSHTTDMEVGIHTVHHFESFIHCYTRQAVLFLLTAGAFIVVHDHHTTLFLPV